MKSKSAANQQPEKKIMADAGERFVGFIKYIITVAVLVAVIVMLPLSLVWKQVYITRTSMQYDSLKDSLAVLNREIAVVSFRAEKLSSTGRIETIAKERLQLDYPLSPEIVVVRPEKKQRKAFALKSTFWTVLRKSLTAEKG